MSRSSESHHHREPNSWFQMFLSGGLWATVAVIVGALLQASTWPTRTIAVLTGYHFAAASVASGAACALALLCALHLHMHWRPAQRRTAARVMTAASFVPSVAYGFSYAMVARELQARGISSFTLMAALLFLLQLPRALDHMLAALDGASEATLAAASALGLSQTTIAVHVKLREGRRRALAACLYVLGYGFQSTAAFMALASASASASELPHIGLRALQAIDLGGAATLALLLWAISMGLRSLGSALEEARQS